jgi:hypothetical protein
MIILKLCDPDHSWAAIAALYCKREIQGCEAAKKERINAMTDTTIGLDRNDEEILTYEVSDEALETAAGTGKEKAGHYTLGYCTGLSACPGQ